jgi:dTDP-4-dehydro-6-deoxy-alpha-D-glucopyranose 2,3-dehydratase
MSQVRKAQATLFLESALTQRGNYIPTDEALVWLNGWASDRTMVVNRIRFEDLDQWSFNPDDGDLVHRSGKFFRVRGVAVHTDLGFVSSWDQPIIDQPEIGILGILVRETGGLLHLLMQAKMEPGNPLGVQLVPTVQATRSNYMQVHHGLRPDYLDYFLQPKPSNVMVDELQYEQGSAFLRKRNRNIVVRVDEDVPVLSGFQWLTLGQVKALLGYPNLVSMDTRTVIACMPLVDSRNDKIVDAMGGNSADFASRVLKSYRSREALTTDESIVDWLGDLRRRHPLAIERVELSGLRGWHRSETEISHASDRFFRVIAVDVTSDSREVRHWTQPLVASAEQGLIAFLVTDIEGTLHALVQARSEPGSADTLTVGPTVQCALTYEGSRESAEIPYMRLVMDPSAGELRYSRVQSEEGGRFFRVENEYRFVEIIGGQALALPPTYRWISFRQLQDIVQRGLLTVEGRSLLACLRFS